MYMGLQELRQHGGIVREDFQRLRFVGDIENAQATLIVQKRTAHAQPLVSKKQLLHKPAMFPIKRLLRNRLPWKPGWARGVDDDEHHSFSFSNQRCASWYKALRSSPWMGGMMCWLPTRGVPPGLVRLLGSRGQKLRHCRSKGLQSVGGPHHPLKIADLAGIVKLDDIHPFHAHR